MYVTRRLSHYNNSPDSLSVPPECPNSGYLVIQDEESERYCCFGMYRKRDVDDLPFPQNKKLVVRFVESHGEDVAVHLDPVLLIPVLGHPLSSNRYYAIKPNGKHKGEAFTCSKEEDKVTCCFRRCVSDVKPKPFDPHNIYQQFEIFPYVSSCNCKGSFIAKSVALDGFPPTFLRREGWQIGARNSKKYKLEEASGLDLSSRERLPELIMNTPASTTSSEAVVVGKWYCPFMFIRDGTLKNQMEKSKFYELKLEQRWEQVFTCQKDQNAARTTSVVVDVVVETQQVLISGCNAVLDERNLEDGVIWFRSYNKGREETSVGLRHEVVDGMKWVQERGGWQCGEEKEFKVERIEECGQFSVWREFGCYVLVDRFVFKRMNGSLVMTYSFRHSDKIKSIWV